VADFFERSCAETVDAIQKQVKDTKQAHVFMVGGFAASPWLYGEVKGRLANVTPDVYRDDSQTAKAVAHGAVAYWLDRSVMSRVAKNTYGVGGFGRSYDEDDPTHQARRHKMYVSAANGYSYVPGGWECLVQKGDLISVGETYRSDSGFNRRSQEAVSFTKTLERYSGTMRDVTFRDMDDEAYFGDVCTFKATLPGSAATLHNGRDGEYWRTEFCAVLTFGTTELQCFVEWEEEGTTRRAEATSVWEDF